MTRRATAAVPPAAGLAGERRLDPPGGDRSSAALTAFTGSPRGGAKNPPMDVSSPVRRLGLGWPALAAGALLAVAAGTVLARGAVVLDREIFVGVHQASAAAGAAGWAATLSVLGLGAAVVLLAAADGPRSARLLASMVLAVLLGGVLVQALKHGLAVPRPLAVLGPDSVQVVGMRLASRSMPSGHAAAVAGLVVCIALDRPRRPWRLGAAVLLALGVLWARMAAGVHWPSDLLVGSGIGVLAACLVAGPAPMARLLDAAGAALLQRAGSRMASALLVVLAAFLWVNEREQPQAEAAYAALAALGLASALAWWRLHPGHRRAARGKGAWTPWPRPK